MGLYCRTSTGYVPSKKEKYLTFLQTILMEAYMIMTFHVNEHWLHYIHNVPANRSYLKQQFHNTVPHPVFLYSPPTRASIKKSSSSPFQEKLFLKPKLYFGAAEPTLMKVFSSADTPPLVIRMFPCKSCFSLVA